MRVVSHYLAPAVSRCHLKPASINYSPVLGILLNKNPARRKRYCVIACKMGCCGRRPGAPSVSSHQQALSNLVQA